LQIINKKNKVMIYTIIGWVCNVIGFSILWVEHVNNYSTLMPVISFSIALICFIISIKKNGYV